jgi:hypothetical protein
MAPPELLAEFPDRVTFVRVGVLASSFSNAPPQLAELPENVTFVNVRLLAQLYMAPPQLAELPENVQLVSTGELPPLFAIPPAELVTVLLVKVTSVSFGLQL